MLSPTTYTNPAAAAAPAPANANTAAATPVANANATAPAGSGFLQALQALCYLAVHKVKYYKVALDILCGWTPS